MQQVKQLKIKVEKFVLKLLTAVSLNLTYFLGIGLTSIAGKIVGKKFLPHSQKSSWNKANYQTQLRKMF